MSDTDIDDILNPPESEPEEEQHMVFHPTVPPLPPEVSAAISKVMGSIKKLHKTDRNEFQRYNYASADTFFEAVGPLMADAGLITLTQQVAWRTRQITTDKERVRNILLIDYDIYLAHSSGAIWQFPLRRTVNVDAGGPQQWGGASTFVEKQFMRQLFKVPTGEAGGDADEQPDYKEQPKQRRRVPVPGYDPTPPPERDFDSGRKIEAKQNVGAAVDNGNSSQSNQAEESIAAYMAALTHQDSEKGLRSLYDQFRTGPGRGLTRPQQERCINAFNQRIEQVQRSASTRSPETH